MRVCETGHRRISAQIVLFFAHPFAFTLHPLRTQRRVSPQASEDVDAAHRPQNSLNAYRDLLVLVATAILETHAAPSAIVHLDVANAEVRALPHPEAEAGGVANHEVLDLNVRLQKSDMTTRLAASMYPPPPQGTERFNIGIYSYFRMTLDEQYYVIIVFELDIMH